MRDEDKSCRGTGKGQYLYPLVTLALVTFNQEKFIHDALLGAVNQNYENLEIIISDDCSSDNTFKLIQNFFKNYRCPHTIIINRNFKNLGIGLHINKINELAHGDLIVAAAGDDISFSHRVSDLVKFWLASGKPAAMSSQAVVISQSGEIIADRFRGYDEFYPTPGESRSESIKRLLTKDHCILLGCTEAWTPAVFRLFGPLNDRVVHEDNVISLRAWLLDRVAYLDKPLIKYRTHDSNIAFQAAYIPRSIYDFTKRELTAAVRQRNKVVNLQHYLSDLKVAFDCGFLQDLDLDLIDSENIIGKRIQFHTLKGMWWDLNLIRRIGELTKCAGRQNIEVLYWSLPRLFGLRVFSIGRAFLALGSRCRRQILGLGGLS